jgi:Tol biopolymer transport system component
MEVDDCLIELAAVLADGGTPDWAAADTTGDQTAVLARLRTIAEIARLHQTISGSAPALGARDARQPPAIWNGLELVEIIGEGRFGTVYRAFDPSLDREIAVKLLHARDDSDVDGERVVEEGRLAALVRHPNVVAIHGARRVDGRTGVWMELVRGRTLETELAAGGPLPVDSIRQVAIQLSRALAAVHGAGLVHRDVKTTNVMRDDVGRIVLGDFGTGREVHDSDCERSGLAGTPPYLAPEIFQGQPATPATDLYSLGVLLFRLATGAFPVRGRSIPALRAAHLRGNGTSVRALRSDLPRRLARTIDRLLDPDPQRRLSSAAAVEAALTRSLPRPAVIAATVAGMAVLGALLLWRVDAPSLDSPFRLEHIDAAFQQEYALYGPTMDGRRFPCRSRTPPVWYVVAICDLERKTMTTLRAAGPKVGSYSASVSPDGQLIAYSWQDDPSMTAVYVSAVDGTSVRKLLELPLAAVERWRPDGAAIVVRDPSPGRPPRLLEVPIDGRPATVLWQFDGVSRGSDVSPDGRSIVVASQTGTESDLFGFALDTGKQQWHLTLAGMQSMPVWTPSGRAVVFTSDHLGGPSVMSVQVGDDGRAAAPVVHHTIARGSAILRGFGAGGALYVWITPPTRDAASATIDVVDGTASPPQLLEPTSISDTMGADWSPDGRQVVYLRGTAGVPGAAADLVIHSPDEGRERRIRLPGFLVNMGPRARWSPDGRRIAVLFAVRDDAGQRWALGMLEVATEQLTVIATGGELRAPSWDPRNGELLYFADGIIQRYSPETGTTTTEYRPGSTERISVMAGAHISRTGTLAAAFAGGRCRIRLIRNSAPPQDLAPLPGECSSIAWTADGSHLLVGVMTRPRQLWVVDPSAGTRRQIALEASMFWDLSIDAAGRLLYTDGDRPANLWRMTGLPR